MDKEMTKKSVVIIGSGNVATSFALTFKDKCEVLQIYSRTLANAQALAKQVGCEATDNLQNLVLDADVYIVAVNDDAITSVANAVHDNGSVWVHTSGSTPINVFEGIRCKYGVIWPMQSLSKKHPADMSQVHFFVVGEIASKYRGHMQLKPVTAIDLVDILGHQRSKLLQIMAHLDVVADRKSVV